MDNMDKLLEVLCAINPKIAEDREADLLQSGYIDSFEIVNVVMELEEAFDIEIDPELIVSENFQTVDAILRLIESISE